MQLIFLLFLNASHRQLLLLLPFDAAADSPEQGINDLPKITQDVQLGILSTPKCSIPWRGWETGDAILFLKNMKNSSEILWSSQLGNFNISFSLPWSFTKSHFWILPLSWYLFPVGSCLCLFVLILPCYSSFFFFFLLLVSAVLLAIQILSLSLSACLVIITCRL